MDVTKDLLERLKAEGVEIAEESAKTLIKAVFATATEYVKQSENEYDDLLLTPLVLAEKKLLELAEDINKEDNEA